jgi:hypothetical protein
MTEFYVVNLLADYAHPQTSTLPQAPIGQEPLAIKLCQASQSHTPDEQLRLLKDVGDESLYVSGFFGESLTRSLVDVDYYINMGGAAYGQAARLIRIAPHGDRFGDVFSELADKFPQLVDVLGEVSGSNATTTQAGVLRLYERWVRTRSEWIGRKLRASGLLPYGTALNDDDEDVQ